MDVELDFVGLCRVVHIFLVKFGDKFLAWIGESICACQVQIFRPALHQKSRPVLNSNQAFLLVQKLKSMALLVFNTHCTLGDYILAPISHYFELCSNGFTLDLLGARLGAVTLNPFTLNIFMGGFFQGLGFRVWVGPLVSRVQMTCKIVPEWPRKIHSDTLQECQFFSFFKGGLRECAI